MSFTFKSYTNGGALVRSTRKSVITRALHSWAEELGCFWLLHLYASHLFDIDGDQEAFTVLKIVVKNGSAMVKIEDGNGRVLRQQTVGYTDFPLPEADLFGCWQSPYWVIMLPSDY